jgi:hypothetical protein
VATGGGVVIAVVYARKSNEQQGDADEGLGPMGKT